MSAFAMLALAWLAVPAAQDAAPSRPLGELASAVEEDGRRRWSAAGAPFSGAAHEDYENGMRLETALVDGYEHGVHRLFARGGWLAREVPMHRGRAHGRGRSWFADGRPYLVEYQQRGERVGPQLRWNVAGERERFEFRKDGEDAGWSGESLAGWDAAGTEAPGGHAAFWRAVVRSEAGDLRGALAELRVALRAGYATPMDAFGYGVLAPLASDPKTRAELVELCWEHARESSITLVAPDEPGERLAVTVRLVDAKSGAPLAGALLRVHHTDDAGADFPGESGWNPRLVGVARADADGQLTLRTIRPGYYAAAFDPEGALPRELHFAASSDGDLERVGVAHFQNDPRRGKDRGEALAILVLPASEGQPTRGVLTVPLQERE